MNERIKKMILGTAQLGSRYGIANIGESPSVENAFQILKTAWEAGIRYVDTAPGYGSEAIIGEFVKAQGLRNEIRILTKIPSLDSVKEWKDFVYDSIEASLKALALITSKSSFSMIPKMRFSSLPIRISLKNSWIPFQ